MPLTIRRPLAVAALAAAITLAGCATAPADEWVCDAEGPCYRVAQAPYRPYYGYPGYGYGYGYGLFGFGYWGRPYSYSPPASSGGSSAPPSTGDAKRGISPPRPSRGSPPTGRSHPFGSKRR